jgi:subtilisin family serine protease
MRPRVLWVLLVFFGLWGSPAAADNRFIVRSTLGSSGLQSLPICLLNGCTVATYTLDGTLGQLFLLTTPSTVDQNTFLALLQNTPGIVDAEPDQLLTIVGGLNTVTSIPSGLSDTTPVNYYGTSVWNGYANQPAARIIRVAEAQSAFGVTGTGIVADIDTGVDPNHPALQPVLLQGYDFTRNQPGGSEMNDLTYLPPPSGTTSVAVVNQSTAAVLDQSTAAVLDGTPYAAFGHGTMVLGVIHLVAPKAQLMPLKAFHSDGTGYLSDIIRAVYYAVQSGASVINMSFDFLTPSQEMELAMTYAGQQKVVSVASAGNDGKQEIVYPAAYTKTVMGIASTSDLDTRSSFSNYGAAIVWVAAPGEAIITTYPFGSYAAGWGTSFSAPFVSGGVALMLGINPDLNESSAKQALAYAVWISPDLNNGRVDLYQAVGATTP